MKGTGTRCDVILKKVMRIQMSHGFSCWEEVTEVRGTLHLYVRDCIKKKMKIHCSMIMVTLTSLKIVTKRISHTCIDTWKHYYVFILCKFPEFCKELTLDHHCLLCKLNTRTLVCDNKGFSGKCFYNEFGSSLRFVSRYSTFIADAGGGADVGLRQLGCWISGFVSHRGHGCLSLVLLGIVR